MTKIDLSKKTERHAAQAPVLQGRYLQIFNFQFSVSVTWHLISGHIFHRTKLNQSRHGEMVISTNSTKPRQPQLDWLNPTPVGQARLNPPACDELSRVEADQPNPPKAD